jgi:hypothetical protein
MELWECWLGVVGPNLVVCAVVLHTQLDFLNGKGKRESLGMETKVGDFGLGAPPPSHFPVRSV